MQEIFLSLIRGRIGVSQLRRFLADQIARKLPLSDKSLQLPDGPLLCEAYQAIRARPSMSNQHAQAAALYLAYNEGHESNYHQAAADDLFWL